MDAGHRHQGLGGKLLGRAEAEALADLDPELSAQAWDKSIALAFETTTPAKPATDNGPGFPVDRVLRDL